MASIITYFMNSTRGSSSDVNSAISNQNKTATVTDLFKSVETNDSCDYDCNSCIVKYPKDFKVNEDDKLFGTLSEWSTHLIVATGKSDWVKDVADEEGSVMEAIVKFADVKPDNGRMMISASNIPTPSHPANYDNPTTVLLLPAWLVIKNVTPMSVNTLITNFVNKGPTNSSIACEHKPENLSLPLVVEQLNSTPCPHNALILLCSQGTRDARCGQSAPLLKKEFERHLRDYGLLRDLDDENPGGVGIYFISHVGGHKYAANVIIYRKENAFGLDNLDNIESSPGSNELMPQTLNEEKKVKGAAQCIWLARIRPKDCQTIIKHTVLRGRVFRPETQLRGGFDRTREVYSW
ncbi:Actin patches distal protein 1 [Erysiphe neolycopersici]|uniref:Actin patches distal protein 1 n=1 Tax=Erysiphe neolycopersici TaxID=212602 RepID=A0A420H7S5_9PEZI|nr:Actin patches distal protein 1 [Erysiphe neolycopersici]